MYRLLGKQVYGVLTDYDLSSYTNALKGGYTRTSRQRTGTPPYMACELLMGQNTPHLYRHDIESLFYIMLLTCGRYTFEEVKINKEPTQKMVLRKEAPPYKSWFDQHDYMALGKDKDYFFLSNETPIELSQPFEGFREWLEDIRFCFSQGFRSKVARSNVIPKKRIVEGVGESSGGGDPALSLFDDETLGGHVSYSSFIYRIRDLEGDLEGLVIRYPSDP